MVSNAKNGRHLGPGISGRNGDDGNQRQTLGESIGGRSTRAVFQVVADGFGHSNRTAATQSYYGIDPVLIGDRERCAHLEIRHMGLDALKSRDQTRSRCGSYLIDSPRAPLRSGSTEQDAV